MQKIAGAVAVLSSILAAPTPAHGQPQADLNGQIAELRALVQKLESRVDQLESRLQDPPPPRTRSAPPSVEQAALPQPASPPSEPDPLHGTTVNFLLDGYYGYNFNTPIGRVNSLRVYDVSSHAFSLNQAAIVIENAPDPAKGKRFGARLDLQFGQATESLQGNAANEPRPDVYRSVFQAYGTYVAPLGKGLTLDFGKWSSALGIESNYSKDQMNYSRSFWFGFLPAYHMGVRANYKASEQLSVNYWITNGAQQTEPFKGFKDQLFGFNLQPHKSVNWTFNYYLGQEHPDVRFLASGAPPNLPTEQGLPFQPIRPAPDGRLHILDSYMTWQASPKLTLALEGDYVIERLWHYSPPSHTSGGAGYGRYQLTPKFAIAARAEYFSDRGGLYSGQTQALKETTISTEYKVADGFLLRQEWRRDFSNQPFALTGTLGILKKEQNTATIGLVWWFGQKQGSW